VHQLVNKQNFDYWYVFAVVLKTASMETEVVSQRKCFSHTVVLTREGATLLIQNLFYSDQIKFQFNPGFIFDRFCCIYVSSVL